VVGEAKALELAWTVVRREGLEQAIVGLESIRLSTAAEVQQVLAVNEPGLSDVWYVSFLLKLEQDIASQHPDDLLITVNDQTGEASLHYQM
jgi:hypothetical protein